MGRTEDAKQHLDAALQIAAATHARPMVARIQLAYADAIAGTDAEEAWRLATVSAETATGLGMRGVALRARVTLKRLGETASEVAPAGTVAAGTAVFRREGDYWALAFSGPVFRLKDQKGLVHLAKLLSSPGKEIPALELAGSGLENPSDAGEVLDAAARSAYRSRLEDLAEELEEAEANNDEGRVTVVREEIDALTDQLTAAVGLGGRARKSSSVAERARVSVRNAIASTLKAIKQNDEGLWRHLSKSVRTGNLCSYDPETPTTWQL
jgi:hypothetical protein